MAAPPTTDRERGREGRGWTLSTRGKGKGGVDPSRERSREREGMGGGGTHIATTTATPPPSGEEEVVLEHFVPSPEPNFNREHFERCRSDCRM